MVITVLLIGFSHVSFHSLMPYTPIEVFRREWSGVGGWDGPFCFAWFLTSSVHRNWDQYWTMQISFLWALKYKLFIVKTESGE